MKNNPVTQTEYFKTIKQIVDNLYSSGMIETGSGYCLSMSDIVHKLLYKEGIKSKLIECNLMVVVKSPPGLYLMGYKGFHENQFDSSQRMENHIICITETEVPILIDLSISHIDKNIPFICAPVFKKEEHPYLAEYDFETSTWTYTERVESELPKLHQKSIINRIKLDQEVSKEISFIKTILVVLFCVSSMNFVRGGYDFYQKYVNKTNGFGPNKITVENPVKHNQN
jgi:hypothetical protein